MQRLKRGEPPEPPELITRWLTLSPDLDKTPRLREFLIRTVTESERNDLVASGEARPEDCAEETGPEAKGRFDVRLRLDDRPEIRPTAENYMSSAWLPWAEAERPRRKSIAIYHKLFEIVQLAELGGVEQPIELVWGIGLSRWSKDGFEIDLPLLERLVEIEIDEGAGGEIKIRPRSVRASTNLRPYEEMRIDGASLALDAARRAIAASDADDGVSPFVRDTFEPTTAAFIEDAKIDRLERGFLKNQPFKTLLLPGASLYDLAKVMFPDKFVMLREHFRCVEPIIRFSMKFYPEPLIPLRVATAQERIDPPLVDIYVSDGRRTGDKVNLREAQVIVEEVRRLIEDPRLARINELNRWRSIGIISLIGAKQAATINHMLLDELGEEIMLRHRIACGDSATFQGNERDVVFLSMVADPNIKSAQTAAHFEQRFNVALSRARDRAVLVRSVQEDELNPNDLKAKVIRHFREPMAEATPPTGNLIAMCESDFERDILARLVSRGYLVRPQVGALGYRIDLVAEGVGDRRLAIECDGDKYHGPERWADDMRRQRVLERVGWRFWRFWASSFTLDPDGCMADLFATLERLNINPIGESGVSTVYTEHRIATAFAGAAGTREPTQKSTAAVTEGVTGQTGRAAVSQSGSHW